MSEEIKVKSKEKKYRGKSLEELKQMSMTEVAKYLPSRSRRTLIRNANSVENFVKRCKTKLDRKKRIRTHLRDMIIVPGLVGMDIGIHDGRAFQNINVSLEMVGHRLGEFALTRRRVAHSGAGVGATKGSRTSKK
jgi:small subunit ribosomal protein S19